MMLVNGRFAPQTVRARKLQAVIFDWAGTTVDFGSLAPVRTLQRVFDISGVALSEAEARRDMGLPKRDHIGRICLMDSVKAAWKEKHGSRPSEADVERLYQSFIPLQFACLSEYSSVIEGVPEVMAGIRARGLRVGSTTGYTRAMLDLLLAQAAREGYCPDCSLSPEEVGAGRPHPFMIFETAVRLQIYPLAGIVKVGDTLADIQEGLNAGTWAVGVVKTGNMLGLSKTDIDALPEAELASRLNAGRAELQQAGAHYVIDTLQELENVLEDIDVQLRLAADRS